MQDLFLYITRAHYVPDQEIGNEGHGHALCHTCRLVLFTLSLPSPSFGAQCQSEAFASWGLGMRVEVPLGEQHFVISCILFSRNFC